MQIDLNAVGCIHLDEWDEITQGSSIWQRFVSVV